MLKHDCDTLGCPCRVVLIDTNGKFNRWLKTPFPAAGYFLYGFEEGKRNMMKIFIGGGSFVLTEENTWYDQGWDCGHKERNIGWGSLMAQ